MKTWVRAVKILVGILCLLVFLEAMLRIAGFCYLKKLYTHWSHGLDVSDNSTNIVCLGESSTAGLWVHRSESYPEQLKEMLRIKFPNKKIRVIVPPHVGQNTSQMANRITNYIKLYNPKIIILMVGCNNHWSLTESHITKFLPNNSLSSFKMKIFIFMNNFRTFKVLRYIYLRIKYGGIKTIEGHNFVGYVSGLPQLMSSTPPQWVLQCFTVYKKRFIDLWRYDVKYMIQAAKKFNIPVILMTYPIDISIPTEEFIKIAKEEKIALLRNDLIFDTLIEKGVIGEYIFPRDNWHPSGKGYTLVAGNVFDHIVKNKLLE